MSNSRVYIVHTHALWLIKVPLLGVNIQITRVYFTILYHAWHEFAIVLFLLILRTGWKGISVCHDRDIELNFGKLIDFNLLKIVRNTNCFNNLILNLNYKQKSLICYLLILFSSSNTVLKTISISANLVDGSSLCGFWIHVTNIGRLIIFVFSKILNIVFRRIFLKNSINLYKQQW